MRIDPHHPFIASLSAEERRAITRISSPHHVQELLDGFVYSSDSWYRSPVKVLRDRKAHCYDGAVFAAALLSLLGHPPRIINMFPNERDDEHLVAPFRVRGAWGAVGKSNFVGLRYREPIHRTLRELMISYFEQFYNVAGEKTFRSYTRPLTLSTKAFGRWVSDDDAMERIADRLNTMRRYPVVTPSMVRALTNVDPRSYKAGLQGSIPGGLFKLSPSRATARSRRSSG